MIDWGTFPRGRSAQIYLPAVKSADIIAPPTDSTPAIV
jgi:hypothetical protein